MIVSRRGRGRRRRTISRDEFGGSEDGGLAIIIEPGQVIHVTPPRIATALRFLLARTQSGGQVLPQRIALTAALRGEGVTYLTRSLGSVLAYDTESTVAVVDLNWKLPVVHQPAKGGKSKDDAAKNPSAAPSGHPVSDAGTDEAADVGDDRVGGSEAVDGPAIDNRSDAGGNRQVRNRRNANRRGRNRPGANAPRAVATAADRASELVSPDADSAPADSGAGTALAPAASPAPRATKPIADATLADVLEGDADVTDAIQQTTNPRLALVTAGELALARRPAVAGGRALSEIVGEIAARFDHVLLDLPPVLASSDAIQLAKLSDVYALVVLQGVTPEHQIEAAIRELAGVETLGVVLNRFDSKVPKFLRRMVEA